MSGSAKSKPSYEAFVVSGEGDKTNWTKIGAAWLHEDRKGINVVIAEGLSVGGKLVLREVHP